MAISSPTARGSATATASSSTLTVSPNATIASGQLCLVRTGSYGQVSHTVTGGGQTWTKAGELQDSASNRTVALHWCVVGAQMTGASVITLTLGSAVTGKVMAIEEYTCTGGTPTNVGVATAGDGGTSPPSVTLGSLSSNAKVFIGVVAVAQATSFYAYTQDASYANDTKVGTNLGSQDASCDMGYFSTSNTSDTFNPTVSGMPWAALLTAFEESAGSQTVTPGFATLATTAFAPVIALAVIPAKLSLTLTTFIPLSLNGVYAIPNTAALTITPFAPIIPVTVTPGVTALTTTQYAPLVNRGVIPGTLSLTITRFAVNIVQSKFTLGQGTYVPIATGRGRYG